MSIRIGTRIHGNSRDDGVDGIAEFATKASLLVVVPVLDSLQVELGCSPDEDRDGQ
jgi:hypothetical protein